MPPNIKKLHAIPIEQHLDIASSIDDKITTYPPLTSEGTNNSATSKRKHTSSWGNLVDLEANNNATNNTNKSGISTRDNLDHSHHRIHHYIRKQSQQLVSNHKEVSVDRKRLSEAVKDAGVYSFGIVGVEVWVLEDGLLVRPPGGWWNSEFLPDVDPSLYNEDSTELQEMPHRIYPGVGLAGTLWAESNRSTYYRSSNVNSYASLSRDNSALFSAASGGHHHHRDDHHQHKPLHWRDIGSLLKDPDTAKDERLLKYLESGFGQAAAVPFESWYSKGIVIYLARPTAEQEQLDTMENQVYLACSAQIIGSIIACTDARRASLIKKEAECAKALRKVRTGICNKRKIFLRTKSDGASSAKAESWFTSWRNHKAHQFHTWMIKCRGGNLQIPPAMPARECFYTLLGCFVGLLVLSTMNELAIDISDNELQLLIGPFGALMTLLYGLSSAPASQPRNVILGQAVAGAVSMSFTYIPESVMSIWVRTAVGPAVAITAMVKLGIPHPPAGAHSVIYASGDFGWKFYFLVVLGSIISVIPATIVNNLSEKRQYPTFWGYLPSYVNTSVRQFFRSNNRDTSNDAKNEKS